MEVRGRMVKMWNWRFERIEGLRVMLSRLLLIPSCYAYCLPGYGGSLNGTSSTICRIAFPHVSSPLAVYFSFSFSTTDPNLALTTADGPWSRVPLASV